jgi:hypothetical protein
MSKLLLELRDKLWSAVGDYALRSTPMTIDILDIYFGHIAGRNCLKVRNRDGLFT